MPDFVQLTPQQIQDLRDLEATHEQIRREIERAKEAGLDMSDYEAKYAALEQVRSGLLKVYGGGGRRKTVG